MKVDNIAAMTAMLVRAGFDEGIGYRVLQRVCFSPGDFTMTERLVKNMDSLVCHLHFIRNGSDYACYYYDIGLMKGLVLPERTENGISLPALDIEMNAIDWGLHLYDVAFNIGDDKSWEREKKIALVVSQLNKLSATEEGKYFADVLKLKYWMDKGLEELVGNLTSIRNRYEISQRVYFIDGEAISVDNAYRFLLNRWVEKKMQAKRREEGKDAQRGNSGSGEKSDSKGLLQKKRRPNQRKLKP